MKTNLHHNHAERKYIRFPCDRIRSLKNLRCDQRRSISSPLRYGVHSADNRDELKIGQTSVAVVIDENGGLAKSYQ